MNQTLDLLFGVWRGSPLEKNRAGHYLKMYYKEDEMQILSISQTHLVNNQKKILEKITPLLTVN